MSARRRCQPPYARELRDRLAGDLRGYWGTSPDGQHATLLIVLGSQAWRVAEQWRADRLLTVLPPGSNPAEFDWQIMRASSPPIAWSFGTVSDDELYALARALFRDGSDRLLALPSGLRFVKEKEAAIS